MAVAQKDDDNHFKQYIRDTPYFDMGRPAQPFIKLRGKHADHSYELRDETISIFGWQLFYSDILVYRDADRKIIDHGWYCAGYATGDDLPQVLAAAGLERSFFMTWGSDPRIFTRTMRGPAVDVKNTSFTCGLSIKWQSTQPDWDKFNEEMGQLSMLVRLKAA
jgi:hypothetical protein